MEDKIIQDFINVVYENAGKGNKDILAQKIEKEFDLQKKGAIYFCDSFAVRFCSTKSKSESVSNTVMALKHIKSKVTKLNSAPKGYNVDKILEFLSDPKSVYLLYTQTSHLNKCLCTLKIQ